MTDPYAAFKDAGDPYAAFPDASPADPRLAPATTNVQYGEGADPGEVPMVGQSDYAGTFSPNPTFPQGSRFNPAYDTATKTAAGNKDVPFFVNRLGELVDQTDGESALDTMGTLAARFAAGQALPGPVVEAMFPSGRLEAAQSGMTSGLLGGLKNEVMGAGAGLGAMLRGGEYKPAYDETLTSLDERDRYLRTAYPLSYYGGGGAGAVAGAALTPEIKAGGAGVEALARMLPGQVTRNAPRVAKAAQVAMDTSIASGSAWGSADPGQRDGAAMVGGGMALPLSVLTRGVLKGAPRKPSSQRLLLDEGVPLTPGQISGGFLKSTEDAMTSLPLVGDMVLSSRGKGVEGLNRAAVNRTLAPIGGKLPRDVKVGFDAVTYADDAISSRYDDILEPLTIIPDQEFAATRLALGATVDELPGDVASGIQNILRNRIDKRLEAGTIDGPTWKKIDAELANKSRAYSRSPDPLMHDGADVLDDARVALRDLLERTNPGMAAEIKDVNTAFANLVRVQRAARRAKGGVFSPEQLRNAVLAEDSSSRGRAASMNRALMQDLANAASEVLPSSIPDSGTPRRLMMNLGAGAGLAGSGAISPIPILAAGLASAPYAPGIRGAISGIARNAPRAGQAIAALPGAPHAGRLATRSAPRLAGQLAAQRR
jgi:hypothetical protein